MLSISSSVRNLGILFLFLVVSGLSNNARSQTIRRTTGGDTISADSAATSNIAQAGFIPLGGPAIRETAAAQLQQDQTIVLHLPPGFEWNTNFDTANLTEKGGNSDITISPVGANSTDLAVGNITVTSTEISITIIRESKSAGKGKGPGQIKFTGLEVRPTTGQMPNAGTITHTGTASLGTTDMGSLRMTAGARTSITVETKRDGTGTIVPAQKVIAGDAITVYSIERDQFNNFISNISVGANGWKLTKITGRVSTNDLVISSTARNATFNPELTGSAKIIASDGSSSAVPSPTLTVVPAETDRMVLLQPPASQVTAGQTITPHPILELRDRFGNTVTDDDSRTVTATSPESDISLKGTNTTTPTAGLLEFKNLALEKVDTTSLTFQSNGLTDLHSGNIIIEPAPAANLKYLVHPSNTIKGNTISPAVELQLLDSFGNIVKAGGGTITVSQVDSSGNIGGTLSATTNTDGVARFSGIIIDSTSNSDPLRIEASIQNISMAPVQSDTFLILEEGQLAGFEITTPGNTPLPDQTAGDSFDIKVRAVDGTGATVNDYKGDISLRSTGGLIQGQGIHSGFSNGELTITIADTSAGNNTLTAVNPANSNIKGSAGVKILPASLDKTNTVVAADPSSLVANGESISTITVQLRDRYKNDLITGGEDISLKTDAGTLLLNTAHGDSLAAADNGDGTYTIDLQSPANTETASVDVYRSGSLIDSSLSITFRPGDLYTFAITNISGDSLSKQVAGQPISLSVRALDANGNTTNFDGMLEFASNVGIDGGSTASISNGFLSSHSITINTANEQVALSVTPQNKNITGKSNTFKIVAAAPDPNNSTITASPTIIQNQSNGGSRSAIKVILRDAFGNRNYQPQTVILGIERTDLSPSSASLLGTSFDSINGAYRDTVASTSTIETVNVFGTVNATAIGDTAQVEIVLPNKWDGVPDHGYQDATDWSVASNWSLNRVPTSKDFVTIPSNPEGGVFPIIDEDINIGNLTLDKGASLDINGSQQFIIQSNAIIEGDWVWNYETPSDVIIKGSLTGSGSYTADGAQETFVGGNISIHTYQAAAGGAVLRLNGNQLQSLEGTNLATDELQIRSDALVKTDLNIYNLDIAKDQTLTLSQGLGITADVQNITGNGTLDLTDNKLIIRGSIDLATFITKDASIEFRGSNRQVIKNFQSVANLTINNPAGVRIFTMNDLEVTNQLNLTEGALTLPSGVSLIANNKNILNGQLIAQRIIDGNPGWRMLASPINSTYRDFLDSTITQGFANSKLGLTDSNGDSLQPNVLYYDESAPGTGNQRFRVPSDASNSISAGRGHFIFFFDSVNTDNRYNNPLPDTLSIRGQEFEGDGTSFEYPVTYTAKADTGWNLVGNPFAATIDWDDSNWVKNNMDNTIYIWNPKTGSHLTWNGISGSLENGLIKPFQAFWVKANGNGPPVLSVHEKSKNTQGQFYGKSNRKPAAIEFRLEADTLKKTTHITLSKQGKTNKDPLDAYRLLPFNTDTYLELFTTLANGAEMAINNLPRRFGKAVTIPLHVGGFKKGKPLNGEYTLSWPEFTDIPDEWKIKLVDKKTGKKIYLKKQSFYSFNLSQPKRKKPVENSPSNFQLVNNIDLKKTRNKKRDARFSIHIDPGNEIPGIPNEYSLGSNYPNPFEHKTNIKFGIPQKGSVKILVYDILGRKVRTLIDKTMPAAYHTISWNPSRLASGVYICVMRAGNQQFTEKMTYIH